MLKNEHCPMMQKLRDSRNIELYSVNAYIYQQQSQSHNTK